MSAGMIRPQRTLKSEVCYSGVGIHTGKEVTIRFCPAPVDSGITFQRMDLPGQPVVPARIPFVQDTSRSTMIGSGACKVQTVEHVLAALSAFQVDNLCIQLTDGEPPIGDGSARVFVALIEEAEVIEQAAMRELFMLEDPVYFSHGATHLVALPSDELRISYTLHYPNCRAIGCQYLSLAITQECFKKHIASCRTFALYEEIAYLMESGLIRGGTLENAIVIKDDEILSKEGLRFPDEMVRHKILDLIGDLSLVGIPFLAHIIAIRSGHGANVGLGRELMMRLNSRCETHKS